MSSYGQITLGPVSATYIATTAFTTPGTTTSDMLEFLGVASKKVRVLKIEVAYTGSGIPAAETLGYVVKRSTASTGGTSTALVAVPVDSDSAAAGASGKIFTANPTTGTLVGNVGAGVLPCSVDGYDHTGGAGKDLLLSILYEAPPEGQGQPITLNSASESICINFNGITPAATGAKLAYRITWTEKAT